MKRRDVLAATAILASSTREGAAATQARTFRLGILGFSEVGADPPEGEVFIAELARQGYVVGRNLAIERRFSRQDALDAAASALAALKVDVIYAFDGTQSALAAKRATSSIPIVFTSSDPVAFGLVSSLARPGGNLTGVSIQGPAITSREMEALAEALGTLRSLAYIHPAGAASLPWYASYVAAATSAAKALGVRIEFHEVSAFAAYEPLVQDLVRRRVSAAAPMPTSADYERIAALFLRYRLPGIGPARAGFLLNCAFAEGLIAQRVAYFVGRILGGTKPAELPVEEFSTLRLILNLKTARALGITIPRSLLIRADDVIQ
jgi:putative ABC transport system substrate-binding protein